MKLVSPGFAVIAGVLAGVFASVFVGCAAGNADPTGSGVAGQGGSGTAGAAGSGSGGVGGSCATPPVVSTSWSFSTGRDPSSPTLTCAQAGVAFVQFFMDEVPTQFDCNAHSGMTTAFPAGTYTPRVFLTNAQNVVILTADLLPVTVPSCGTLVVQPVRFVITPAATTGTGGTGGGTAGTGGSGGAGGAGGATGTAGTGGGTGPCNALPIFAMHNCASPGACHDANGTSANFNMASPGWEKNLVGKMPKAGGAAGFASACVGAGKPYLVANSSPATGLFIDKLALVKPECGMQMPLLPSYLTPAELDCVQRWANALTKP